MKISYTIETDQILLCDFLKQLHISKKLLCDIKSQGDLRVNNRHVTVRYLLQKNDFLEIIFPKEQRGLQLDPYDYPLDIIYEDEYLLVINKPAKISCIPDHRYHNFTLANAIIHYYQQINLESTIHFVNRLDRDTQGLLIIAKYRYIHYLFSLTSITRYYYALVEGNLNDITINLPIDRVGMNVQRVVSRNGKNAITHCYNVKNNGDTSLVKCVLETGRTHQIRVHLSTIGHPLVGDRLYHSKTSQNYYLKSYYLSFTHPIYKRTMTFEIEQ